MDEFKIDKIVRAVIVDQNGNELIDVTSSINDKTDYIRGHRLPNVESMNLFCDEFEPIDKEEFEKIIEKF